MRIAQQSETSPRPLRRHGVTLSQLDDLVTAVNVQGEALSSYQMLPWVPSGAGQRNMIPSGAFLRGPVGRHGSNMVVRSIEREIENRCN